MRGEVVVNVTDDVLLNNYTTLYFGICLLNNEDLTVNAPEAPYDHSYSDDWMWWHGAYLESRSATDVRAPIMSCARFPLDVKARRRVDPTDVLVMVVQLVSGSPTPPSAGIVVQMRVLVRES